MIEAKSFRNRMLTALKSAVTRDMLRAGAEAHDQEDCAQRGEPSPWDAHRFEIDDEWVEERLTAMLQAWNAMIDAAMREPVAQEAEKLK